MEIVKERLEFEMGKNNIESLENRLPPRGGNYYCNKLYYSVAYQLLALSARNLLHDFFNELRYEYISKRAKRKKCKQYFNNGELVFTERQFKTRHKCSSATYISSRNKLIEVGLLKQTEKGGQGRGHAAKYKLLCVSGLLEKEEKWKRYPKENWKNNIPKAKNNLVGIHTRFKKGKSGRKSDFHPKGLVS